MAGKGNRERNRRRRLREKSSRYRQDESKKGYGISPRAAFIFFMSLFAYAFIRYNFRDTQVFSLFPLSTGPDLFLPSEGVRRSGKDLFPPLEVVL